MEELISYKIDHDFFIEKLEKNDVFFYSRFNDGEWSCMREKNGKNCDKHQYFKEMSIDLRNACSSEKNAVLSENGKYYFQASLYSHIVT